MSVNMMTCILFGRLKALSIKGVAGGSGGFDGNGEAEAQMRTAPPVTRWPKTAIESLG